MEYNMKIYRIYSSKHHKTYHPEPYTTKNSNACHFDGNIIDNWKPVHLTTHAPEPQMVEELADLSFVCIDTPLLKPNALKVLYPYLKNYVQFLETTTDFGNVYLMNVININDCVNYDECDIVYFPSSDRIMRFEKYSFFTAQINEVEIFKIPDARNTFPFVTEGLKNIIEENGLVGFRFELIYG